MDTISSPAQNGGGPVWLHNSVVRVWSKCFSQLRIVHKIEPYKEPQHCYSGNKNQPDIVMYDSGFQL